MRPFFASFSTKVGLLAVASGLSGSSLTLAEDRSLPEFNFVAEAAASNSNGFVGTIEFTINLSVHGDQSIATNQNANLHVGPNQELRLDLFTQNAKEPIVASIAYEMAWLIAPNNDLVVVSPIDKLNSKSPWARMLETQVNQTRTWANVFFNSGLPVSSEAMKHGSNNPDFETDGVNFSFDEKSFRVQMQSDRFLNKTVITGWNATRQDGVQDSAVFKNFVRLGSGIVARQIDFTTSHRNGRLEKSSYSITRIVERGTNDEMFAKLFTVPEDVGHFPDLIGKLELRGIGQVEKPSFFNDAVLSHSESE